MTETGIFTKLTLETLENTIRDISRKSTVDDTKVFVCDKTTATLIENYIKEKPWM